MSLNHSVRIIVHGRVQGVGFRAWVQNQAELHGLAGWVRNRTNGSVEALFSGPEPAIEAMLKACRQGPAGARVERVDTLPATEEGIGAGFEVRGTA